MGASLVTIQVDDQSFQAEVDDNLLTSCLSHHVDVNFSCRAGVCGACALYDETTNKTILSCQTTVTEPRVFTKHLPGKEDAFRVLERRFLEDDLLELKLIGPGDDAFGDFVELLLADEHKTAMECMALNLPGEPLTLLLSKHDVSNAQWEYFTNALTASLIVKTRLGERKGRLLTELNVAERSICLIGDSNTKCFFPYWQAALNLAGANLLGQLALSDRHLPVSDNSQPLKGELERLFATLNTANIEVVIQTAGMTQAGWNRLLSAFYIRPKQIHIVRSPHSVS